MRFAGLSVLLLICIQLAFGYEVRIVLKNYDGEADLVVREDARTIFEGKISSGKTISLPAGSYTFEARAMDKVLVKDLRVEKDEKLEFNFGFTNSSDVLRIKLHSIVFDDATVEEIVMISNNADLNFEGDLSIPLPKIDNLQVVSSNLDFLDASFEGDAIVFKSLLVPEKGSGGIRIVYVLSGEAMERNLGDKRIVIAPLVEVEEFRGLNGTWVEMEGERFWVLEGSGNVYVKFKFAKFPYSLLSIPLISFAVFMIFFSKRGGWSDENRRP